MKVFQAILGCSDGIKTFFESRFSRIDLTRKLPHKGDITCLTYYIFRYS